MKRLSLIMVSIISILSLLAGCTANDAWQDDFYTTGTIYSWNGTAFVPIGTGGGGTNDHSALVNLDYASAGHTGFEPAIGYSGNPLQYLNGMGNFAIPAGGAGGNVTSSANLTDNTVVRGDGGVLGVQDSGVTIDDFDNLNTNGGDIDAFDINAGNDVNVTNDLDVTDDADIGGQLVVTGNVSAQGNYVLTTDNVNDVPANGVLDEPISSNWAYDHYIDWTHMSKGATVPASPTEGQLFLHTPTGRKIILAYDGANWNPIQSIGTTTLYVDKTDGTDSINYGTGVDAAAVKTVQYAVNLIPGSVGGNVIIYINGESYAETVTIQGKSFTGDYSIALQGTLTVHETHAQTASAQGATTNFGTISDTTNDPFAGHTGDLLYSSNNAEYRVIDSVTTEVATITEYWTAAPSGNYAIYQWATTINSFNVAAGQLNIYAYDIHFTSASLPVNVSSNSLLYLYRCKLYTTASWASFSCADGITYLYDCYVLTAGYCALFIGGGGGCVYPSRCKVVCGSTGIAFIVDTAGVLRFSKACSIDGTTKSSNQGVQINSNSLCRFDGYYHKIRNLGTGVYALVGGKGVYTSNNQYTNNTVNESATAASYGYID